jgi:hypothetical protein
MSTLLDFVPDLKKRGKNVWKGPCPRCGGDDRFQVKVPFENAPGGVFYCFGPNAGRAGCDWSGDGITFLHEYYGWSKSEAARELGVDIQFQNDQADEERKQARERERIRREQVQADRLRREWIRSEMTDEERKIYSMILDLPVRVKRARRQMDAIRDTYAPDAPKPSRSGSYALERMHGRHSVLQSLPPGARDKYRELFHEAQMTAEEEETMDQQARAFEEQVADRLALAGMSFSTSHTHAATTPS